MPNDIEIMWRNVLDQIFDEFNSFQSMKHLAVVVPIILELKCDEFAGVILDVDFR